MDLYKEFGTSKELENDGVEVQMGDVSFFIARMGKSNKKYMEILATLTKPFKRQIEMGLTEQNSEKINKAFVEAFSRGILKNWTNVKDKKGKELPFSPENAMKLFSDLPDLYDKLEEIASNRTTFIEEDAEEVAKK